MKPAPFKYVSALTVDDAVAALAGNPDAKLIAGGQSLVPMMNFRLVRPSCLVDINRIAELKGIRLNGDRISIGSMTRYVELGNSELLRRHVPLISDTIPFIAHSAIRNRGTIGGSISHADPAADLPVALMALDATMHLRSGRGSRALTCDQFFVSLFTTALEPDEVLTSIEVPVCSPSEGRAFTEFARRAGDFALASVAVRLSVRDERIYAPVRIAIGAATPLVTRASSAEKFLLGAEASTAVFEAAALEASRAIDPVRDIHGSADYRRHLVFDLVRSALAQAVACVRAGVGETHWKRDGG